jgi:hypothetical protein
MSWLGYSPIYIYKAISKGTSKTCEVHDVHVNWFKLVWIMWSIVHGCPPQTPPPGQSQAANFTAGLEKFFAQTRADYSTCSLNEAVAALHCLCPVHICSPRCSLWCVFNWCRNWHLSSCPCICSSILYLSLKRCKAKATANYTKQTHRLHLKQSMEKRRRESQQYFVFVSSFLASATWLYTCS